MSFPDRLASADPPAPSRRSIVVGVTDESFPVGASVTLAALERDPHPLLARLREREPVSWVPALRGWLVTRRDLVLEAMRDPETFTVDDPRFSTAQVIGPSMLSLDGEEHQRQRGPFARPFRLAPVRSRFTELIESEVERLLDLVQPAGAADLRSALAGPLSVRVMVAALGLEETDPAEALGWYAAIVAEVTAITAGAEPDGSGREAFRRLRASVTPALDRDPASSLVAAAAGEAGGLTRDQVASNAAVLLFGGIETTEAMIANAFLHVLGCATTSSSQTTGSSGLIWRSRSVARQYLSCGLISNRIREGAQLRIQSYDHPESI